MKNTGARWLVCVTSALVLTGLVVRAQETATAPTKAQAAKDPLGRESPRGTVVNFMKAGRDARDDVAPLYLNTSLRGDAAVELARKLFAVLDRRLPARLSEVSDRPEGSLANPLKADQDVIGTITTADGSLDILVERVNRGALGIVWLFSRKTLDAIPDVYGEIDLVSIDRFLPAFLARPRIAGVRLFAWLVLALVVPLLYRAIGLLGRVFRSGVVMWRRRGAPIGKPATDVVPGAVRLLILAVVTRWLLAVLELPLPERQFWSVVSAVLAIAAIAWALLLLNGAVERYVFHRSHVRGHGEIAAMLRLARRMADVFVVAGGGLVLLHYFGVDPTAALAGLGIGGIAVALAAQKTLENVIGGLSIIFDKAVQVGDFLKLGDTLGTVDDVGLRSTRIRTLDRTILNIPNGQIANANIETLSARDKFWFHHFIGLRYETTSSQMRALVAGIRDHLAAHRAVDRREPIRVRFLRFGQFSFDVEIFAYVFAADWEAFLETQQELLLRVLEIVEQSGASIALPSQTLHLAPGTDVVSRGTPLLGPSLTRFDARETAGPV